MEIKAPEFPESITEGTVAQWHHGVGEFVRRDELLADIETDKVVIDVVAPDDGHITEIVAQEGETVESQQVIAHFQAGAVPLADDGSTDPAETQDDLDMGASPAAKRPGAAVRSTGSPRSSTRPVNSWARSPIATD